ncbi:hypothetical protein J4573_02585 [Actinomadura barringtoniae]|uniref:Uncharacterized protein n=1 Tax=Actinomadura barringtoniae TaxID=1427535 RepID=A0A939P6B4_9ACTN|nr:hypothetical protein [Actinomadura barringtoniae]MBO2445965.1 hypothetical protein [Actinomadura barringtoniae]
MTLSKLSYDDVAYLLRDLCIDLGFCLPPEDQARLCASPPADIDSFTDAVFQAEGMDPLLHKKLRRRVRETVAKAFEAD